MDRPRFAHPLMRLGCLGCFPLFIVIPTGDISLLPMDITSEAVAVFPWGLGQSVERRREWTHGCPPHVTHRPSQWPCVKEGQGFCVSLST